MRLMLFGTSGCHLCEQAEVIVNACVPDGVEYVDIAEQEQWQEQYALRIPVLYHPETKQELGWPFDLAGIENFIHRRDHCTYPSEDIIVVLEWEFSPPNYFEETIEISNQLYIMTISDGRVKVEIKSTIFNANPSMRKELNELLNNRFLAVQLITHKPYELLLNTKTEWIHPDGHNDIEIGLSGNEIKISQGALHHLSIDQNGNVISDSKKNQNEKTKNFMELIAKYNTPNYPLVSSLLESYKRAVNDIDNEFIHLYEIRDALCTKFKNEHEAIEALKISKNQWNKLRSLCNNKELKQGRHRGQNNGALRSANEEELKTARNIAKDLIIAYLHYLTL